MPQIAINVTSNANIEKYSRFELLQWINSTLEGNFKAIAELCTGAAYCQFMDMLFPGSVAMRRIKFQTNLPHEYVNNFKLLQAAFKKMQVDKIIPVSDLIKATYIDNLHFAQWFRKFFEHNYNERWYDANAARRGVPLGFGTSTGIGSKFKWKALSTIKKSNQIRAVRSEILSARNRVHLTRSTPLAVPSNIHAMQGINSQATKCLLGCLTIEKLTPQAKIKKPVKSVKSEPSASIIRVVLRNKENGNKQTACQSSSSNNESMKLNNEKRALADMAEEKNNYQYLQYAMQKALLEFSKDTDEDCDAVLVKVLKEIYMKDKDKNVGKDFKEAEQQDNLKVNANFKEQTNKSEMRLNGGQNAAKTKVCKYKKTTRNKGKTKNFIEANILKVTEMSKQLETTLRDVNKLKSTPCSLSARTSRTTHFQQRQPHAAVSTKSCLKFRNQAVVADVKKFCHCRTNIRKTKSNPCNFKAATCKSSSLKGKQEFAEALKEIFGNSTKSQRHFQDEAASESCNLRDAPNLMEKRTAIQRSRLHVDGNINKIKSRVSVCQAVLSKASKTIKEPSERNCKCASKAKSLQCAHETERAKLEALINSVIECTQVAKKPKTVEEKSSYGNNDMDMPKQEAANWCNNNSKEAAIENNEVVLSQSAEKSNGLLDFIGDADKKICEAVAEIPFSNCVDTGFGDCNTKAKSDDKPKANCQSSVINTRICRIMESQKRLKELADKLLHLKKDYEIVNTNYNVRQNELPSTVDEENLVKARVKSVVDRVMINIRLKEMEACRKKYVKFLETKLKADNDTDTADTENKYKKDTSSDGTYESLEDSMKSASSSINLFHSFQSVSQSTVPTKNI